MLLSVHSLRRAWGLEAILREAVPSYNGENKGKPRTDHRHHAIDAIVIALTTQGTIQRMSEAAARVPSWQRGPRAFRALEAPWRDFVPSIRPHIEGMVVSHRPEHKMSGELHDESNYGQPRKEGKKTVVHIRKPLAALKSEKDIACIVDPVVRQAVQEKFSALGGDLGRCESAHDWPLCPARDGKAMPVRRVRMRKVMNAAAVGEGNRQRFVMPSSKHHVEIFAKLDPQGREGRWDSLVVSLMEASERKRQQDKEYKRSGVRKPAVVSVSTRRRKTTFSNFPSWAGTSCNCTRPATMQSEDAPRLSIDCAASGKMARCPS